MRIASVRRRTQEEKMMKRNDDHHRMDSENSWEIQQKDLKTFISLLSSHFAQCMLKWSHLTRHKFFGHFSAEIVIWCQFVDRCDEKERKEKKSQAAMTSTRQQQQIERRMRLNFSRFLFVKNFRFLIFLLSYQTTNWMAQARAQYSQESHAAVWGRTGSFFVCLRWWVRVFDFFYLSKTPPV